MTRPKFTFTAPDEYIERRAGIRTTKPPSPPGDLDRPADRLLGGLILFLFGFVAALALDMVARL